MAKAKVKITKRTSKAKVAKKKVRPHTPVVISADLLCRVHGACDGGTDDLIEVTGSRSETIDLMDPKLLKNRRAVMAAGSYHSYRLRWLLGIVIPGEKYGEQYDKLDKELYRTNRLKVAGKLTQRQRGLRNLIAFQKLARSHMRTAGA